MNETAAKDVADNMSRKARFAVDGVIITLLVVVVAIMTQVSFRLQQQIDENEVRAHEARQEAEKTEQRSAERYRKASAREETLAEEMRLWRAEMRRLNPDVIIPKFKGEKDK